MICMAADTPFRPALLAALVLAAALALSGCGKGGRIERAPQRNDQPVARVNGGTVWASDVRREAVAQGLIGQKDTLEVSSVMFHRVLDEVIDQRLLASEALRRRLDKDPVAQRRLAAARDRVLGDMLVEAVVADVVTDNAVRGLYQEQLKLARRPEEIHARRIVLTRAADAEAVKKLLAAGASFEALAMARSTDAATRFNGGDLGYFTLDVMPPPYQAALKDARPGAVAGPFAVDGGFALVKVEDRRLQQPITLEAARPQIVRFLTYDQIRDLLEKLRGAAKIQTLLTQDHAPPSRPADAPALPSLTGPRP
jgi:peptidyl-prolyl cis-trans isomerase C